MATRTVAINGNPIRFSSPKNIADREFEAPIIEMLRLGEADKAVVALSERYSKQLTKFVWRILKNKQDAEDVIQDTFIHILKYPGSFIPKHSATLRTIITTSALRRSIGMLKRTPRCHEVSMDNPEIDESKLHRVYLAQRNNGSALHQMISEQRKSNLRGAISNLPQCYQAIMELRYYDELSIREIAQITQATIPAIKSKLYNGRQMLRKELK